MSRPPFIPDEVRTRARDAYALTLGYDGQPLPETFGHALSAALGVVDGWLKRAALAPNTDAGRADEAMGQTVVSTVKDLSGSLELPGWMFLWREADEVQRAFLARLGATLYSLGHYEGRRAAFQDLAHGSTR